MKTPRRAAPSRFSKKFAITLGDLIAAAYEASEGFGRERAERAARLLGEFWLARRYSRRLQFVR